MDHGGQLFPPRDIAVMRQRRPARPHLSMGAAGNNQQPCAAHGALMDILYHRFIDISFRITEEHTHRRENHPVFHFNVTNPYWIQYTHHKSIIPFHCV